MEAIIQMLRTDREKLIDICKADFEEVTEYQLFTRCLSDQTVVENDKRHLRTEADGTMNSLSLQNPSDPDATYRNKAGKLYRGYAANLEETQPSNAGFHLSVIIVLAAHIKNSADQKFTKMWPPS